MALNNCTINSQSFQKIAGAAIGSNNSQLVITPNEGYTVSASNFQNNSGSIAGILSISLIDSGTPGTVSNTVLVNIDLDDNYVMPSADTEIVIDIDGSADIIPYTISGVYNTVVSNTTSSNENDISYSGSGDANQQVTLFSKTFTADSGYYFLTPPYYEINSAQLNRYEVTHVDTLDSENRITARTFTVKYRFPNQNHSNDLIDFIAQAVEIFTPTVEITSYTINTSVISLSGITRSMQVFGYPGAEFSLSVENEDDTSIVNIVNQEIPTSGFYSFNIEFPASLEADQYDFVLTGDLSSDFDTANGQDSTFSILQINDVRIDIGLQSLTNPGIIISPVTKSKYLFPLSYPNSTDRVFNTTFTISVASPNTISIDNGTVNLSEFTNTNSSTNGGTVFDIESLTFTQINPQTIEAELEAIVDYVGSTPVTSLLDIDSYISASTSSTAYNSAISVSGCSDTDGNAITITPIESSNVVVGATLQTLGSGSYRLAQDLVNGQTYTISNIITTQYVVNTDSNGVIQSITQCSP